MVLEYGQADGRFDAYLMAAKKLGWCRLASLYQTEFQFTLSFHSSWCTSVHEVCFVVYFGKFGSNSSSVIAENQYFATFLAVPLIAGLAGCVLGHLFTILKR